VFKRQGRRFVYVSQRLVDEIALANPTRGIPLLKRTQLPVIGGGIELDWSNSSPSKAAIAIRRSTKAARAKSLKKSGNSGFFQDNFWLRWGELEVMSPARRVAWFSGFDSETDPRVFVALCGSLQNYRDWKMGKRQGHEGWYPSTAYGMNEVLEAWEQNNPALAREAARSESREEWSHTASTIHETLGRSYWVDSGKVEVLFECYFRTDDVRYLHLPDSVTEAVFGAPVWVAK